MSLPILLSVPHAGLDVPAEVRSICRLSHEEIVADGDVGAAEIFALEAHVAQFVTTPIARAIVDLNRAVDDFRPDGIIKTETCWNVPVYEVFPERPVIDQLLERFYWPYHRQLENAADSIQLCVDCHTMAAEGPPIGPDPGKPRPHVCLGDVGGKTLPKGWMRELAHCFETAFQETIAINQPFSGGHITRTHGQKRPWVQIELSRAPFLTNEEKRVRVLQALTDFCERFQR